MATLEQALLGLNTRGIDTGYGIATQAIGQMTPQLINPYGSTGQAIGIGLGSILLQSLLGYQARQQAVSETLEANTLASKMMAMAGPEARTEFIGGIGDPMQQARLSTLSTALTTQEQARKIKAADKLLELETAADFELGPKGTELFERRAQGEALRQAAITGAFQQRQEVQDELLRGRALERKQLQREDVNIPAGILSRAIERNASSDLALDVAQSIDTYESIPEFAAAKSISAFGDDQLKSRLRNLATIVLQSRSGLAATDRERDNLNKILTGDFTAVSPGVVSGLLKRFALDEKTIAADTVAAGTQRPEAFVGELRQALQEGRKTQFGTRTPSYALPAQTTAATPPAQPAEADQKLQILRQLQAELAAEKAKRGR
jgi:hypothetical protein